MPVMAGVLVTQEGRQRPQLPLPPMVMPNKTANTITVRATAPVVDVIERLIRANDKPRAEVVLDVEILEVNREPRQAVTAST